MILRVVRKCADRFERIKHRLRTTQAGNGFVLVKPFVYKERFILKSGNQMVI